MARIVNDDGRRHADAIGLALLLPSSLFLTAMTNRLAGAMLNAHAPKLAWIATTAFPSCMLIGCIYLVSGNRRALEWPSPGGFDTKRIVGLSRWWLGLWIGGCLLFAIFTGRWLTYASGWAPLAAFLIFGPLGEELLFRGILFDLAHRLWAASPIPAIALSAAAFSLHHLSLDTAPAGLMAIRLLFTIPMGIVLAVLRERTASLWPGLLLHLATNLPAAF